MAGMELVDRHSAPGDARHRAPVRCRLERLGRRIRDARPPRSACPDPSSTSRRIVRRTPISPWRAGRGLIDSSPPFALSGSPRRGLADIGEGNPVDLGAVEAARRRDEQRQVVEEAAPPASCRRRRRRSAAARAAARRTWRVSGRIGSSQNQPSLANIASRQRWASSRLTIVRGPPRSSRPAHVPPRTPRRSSPRPRRRPRRRAAPTGRAHPGGERRPPRWRRRSPPASRSNAARSGPFQRPSAASAHSAAPAQHAVVAAPRRPLRDPDDRVRPARLLGDRLGEADDVEAAIRGSRFRRDEALEEEVAELLVVAVELAVGRDERERRQASARSPPPSRAATRSRAKRSASDVASGSNETDVDSPAS